MSRQLTSWFDAYCEYVEDFEPPTIFNKWIGLLVLSTATQRKVWFPDGNNTVYPNLYVLLVGPSGSGKTSAMREALPFIAKCGIGLSPAKVTSAKLIQNIEAGQTLGSDGLPYTPYLIWAEEFPTFLGPTAYESGMIADLTALYDCPSLFEKQTKTQSNESIHNPYICLLGGATPEGIFDVLPPGTICQGFTSRLMFVYSGYTDVAIPEKPWGKKQQDLQRLLLEDLDCILQLKGPMKLSIVGRTLWKDYYVERRFKDLEDGSDSRLHGFKSRKPFYVKKLMTLLSIAESNSMVIEAQHLEKAIVLLDELDLSLSRVYGQISPSIIINMYPRFCAALARAPGHILDRATMQRSFSKSIDADQFDKVVRGLEQQELVELEFRRDKLISRLKRYYKLTPKGIKEYADLIKKKGEK